MIEITVKDPLTQLRRVNPDYYQCDSTAYEFLSNGFFVRLLHDLNFDSDLTLHDFDAEAYAHFSETYDHVAFFTNHNFFKLVLSPYDLYMVLGYDNDQKRAGLWLYQHTTNKKIKRIWGCSSVNHINGIKYSSTEIGNDLLDSLRQFWFLSSKINAN